MGVLATEGNKLEAGPFLYYNLQREVLSLDWRKQGADRDDMGVSLGMVQVDAVGHKTTPVVSQKDSLRDIEVFSELVDVVRRTLVTINSDWLWRDPGHVLSLVGS